MGAEHGGCHPQNKGSPLAYSGRDHGGGHQPKDFYIGWDNNSPSSWWQGSSNYPGIKGNSNGNGNNGGNDLYPHTVLITMLERTHHQTAEKLFNLVTSKTIYIDFTPDNRNGFKLCFYSRSFEFFQLWCEKYHK